MADKPLPRDFDWDAVDPEAQEKRKEGFPYIQWHHGKSELEELGNDVRHLGGFLFNTSQKHQFGDEPQLPGFQGPVQVKLGNEKKPCLYATELDVAIIRRRFCWTTTDSNGKERFFSAKGREKQEGWKGKSQFLVVPKGVTPEEARQYRFALTAKSTTGGRIGQALREHIDELVPIANRSVPRGTNPMPSYAFWTHISTSPHKIVGEGQNSSEVTYPVLKRPKDVTREFMLSIYVGKPHLIEFQQIYKEAEEWATAWDTDSGVQSELAGGNPNDVWAATDDQVSSFVQMSAALKDRGESLERINKIARDLVNVSDIRHATPAQMNVVLTELNDYLRKHDHAARMALQAPSTLPPDAFDNVHFSGDPSEQEIPFN